MKYLLLGLVMLAVATTAVANNDRDAVNQTLNALHHNASIADFEQYFGLYHDSAIFIGTDASEVWTKEAFKCMPNLTLTRAEDGHTTRETGISIFP